jgi:hypothetical protein
MTILGLSNPQMISATSESGLILDFRFVVVATTDDESIKLYYSSTDDPESLKSLMLQNDVPELIALTVLNTTGFHLKNLNGDDPSVLYKQLPGMYIEAIHPVTKAESKLWTVVISLNDEYKWTRESIAEWIENTFDINDIAFKPGEVECEKGKLSESTKLVKIKRIL